MPLEIADRYHLELQDARDEGRKSELRHAEREADLKSQFEARLRTFEADLKDDFEYALSYIQRYQQALVALDAADPLYPYVRLLFRKYNLTVVPNPHNDNLPTAHRGLSVITGLTS